jgi:hypothetical protein
VESVIDGLVKSPISALRAISQNFTYAKYSEFFDIAQALILNFLQGRPMTTFYETISDCFGYIIELVFIMFSRGSSLKVDGKGERLLRRQTPMEHS